MCKLSLDLVIAHTAEPERCANTPYLPYSLLPVHNNDPYNITIRVVTHVLGTQEAGGTSEGGGGDL